jgi:hypothetical protein
VQEEGLNTISQNKSENEVNKKYNNFILVVEKEFLWKLFSGIARRGKYNLKRVS